MSKKFAFGLVLILTALCFLGCQSKELRTSKIELGTWKNPKSSPNLERVKANLEDAEKATPNNPEIFHLRGRVYAMENNFEGMDKAFEKCDGLSEQFKAINDTIRMMEWDTLFIQNAVKAYQGGEYEAALEKSKNAIICWKNNYQPYLYGADAAYRMANNDLAYDMAKAGYEVSPDTVTMARLYAEMCFVNNKLDEAKGVFEKLIINDPSNADYYFNLGEIELAHGDTTKALDYYEQGLTKDKDNPDGWLNIAKLYFLIKKYAESVDAFEHYKSLSETVAKDDTFLYLLAVYQVEDYEKGKTELEAFTMEYPDFCEAWQLLGNTYIHLKMKKEAKAANAKYDDCTGQ